MQVDVRRALGNLRHFRLCDDFGGPLRAGSTEHALALSLLGLLHPVSRNVVTAAASIRFTCTASVRGCSLDVTPGTSGSEAVPSRPHRRPGGVPIGRPHSARRSHRRVRVAAGRKGGLHQPPSKVGEASQTTFVLVPHQPRRASVPTVGGRCGSRTRTWPRTRSGTARPVPGQCLGPPRRWRPRRMRMERCEGRARRTRPHRAPPACPRFGRRGPGYSDRNWDCR
jgi:hypothetical protein